VIFKAPEDDRVETPNDEEFYRAEELPRSRTDSYFRPIGEGMPPDGIARIGSLRFRHPMFVTCLRVSPDGRHAISGCVGGTAIFSELPDGRRIHLFPTDREVNAVAISPDGALALTAGRIQAALWNTQSGERLRELKRPEATAAEFSDVGRAVLGTADGKLASWEVRTGRLEEWGDGHRDAVLAIAISPDGRWALTGSADGAAILWNLEQRKKIKALWLHQGSVNSVSFSSDGRLAAAAGANGALRVIDPESGDVRREWRASESDLLAVAFSPDGSRLLTGGVDGHAILWDAQTGEKLREFKGHRGWVTCAAFLKGGDRALTAGADRTLLLWNVRTGGCESPPPSEPVSVEFNPRGNALRWIGSDRICSEWNPETGRKMRDSVAWTPVPTSGDVSPDGAFRLIPDSWGDVAVVNRHGDVLRKLSGHEGRVICARFSPTGRKVATCSTDMTAMVWQPCLDQAIASRAWARSFEVLQEPFVSQAFQTLVAHLGSDDLVKFCAARERIIALQSEGVRRLELAFPRPGDAREIERFIAGLDDEDPEARERAKARLAGIGRPVLRWIRESPSRTLSPEIRQALEEIESRVNLPNVRPEEIALLRAVLILIDMLPDPAAREALRIRSEWREWGPIAEAARRALE
jgi:WD40 repeat protein